MLYLHLMFFLNPVTILVNQAVVSYKEFTQKKANDANLKSCTLTRAITSDPHAVS